MCDKMKDLGILPNEACLFRKSNKAGGYTYYSNEVGGGITVWNTCLVAESTLLTAIVCEHRRKHMQSIIDRGWKLTPEKKRELEMENVAATGGSFLGPIDTQLEFPFMNTEEE